MQPNLHAQAHSSGGRVKRVGRVLCKGKVTLGDDSEEEEVGGSSFLVALLLKNERMKKKINSEITAVQCKNTD